MGGVGMEAAAYICLALMLFFGTWAVMTGRLIRSAIFLAIVSAAAGTLMYLLDAPWAGIFEISVCSGLVTVVVIAAISFSHENARHVPQVEADRKRMRILPLLLIVAGAGLVLAAVLTGFRLPQPLEPSGLDFREVLWRLREVDVWGQMIVLVAGAAAVVVFFRERS